MSSSSMANKIVSPGQQPAAPVVLADNFPSKAHLLVTNVTQQDPNVITFSPDGDAFYVYDQSTFAQKYLPQYFKHSNYGSFVRQLNLYGFTSSRHKDNTDVVVWSHPDFHRDNKDKLKNIKRTVKKTTKKPSHVYVSPRPASASVSSEEIISTRSNDEGASDTLLRQCSSKGEEWLESELAYLKEQNRNLEAKLDLLLKITLTLSPSSLEEFQLGEKRRRTQQGPSIPPSYQSSNQALDVIRENAPTIEPYQVHENGEADNSESMKAFVDIMLNDEDDEANSGSDSDIDENAADSPNAHVSSGANDTYEDELMAEAMHAILPENGLCDDDDFNLSFDETEELPENIPASTPDMYHPMANRAVDKSSGPDAVLSSDSYNFDGDIEEGNAPLGLGVHIVSAHAELVEDDDSKGDDSVNDRRAWRKKVMCMLSVMFAILVIICITVPAVILTKEKHEKKNVNIWIEEKDRDEKWKPFSRPALDKKPWDGATSSEDPVDDDEYYAFDTTTTANLTQARSGVANLFPDREKPSALVSSSFVPDGFTINVGDVSFKCTQAPTLL
jgi:hypothetical protein